MVILKLTDEKAESLKVGVLLAVKELDKYPDNPASVKSANILEEILEELRHG